MYKNDEIKELITYNANSSDMKSKKESVREKFFNVLRSAFCGKVKDIEGQSATAKLMRIKSKHYQYMEKHIEGELKEILAKYPDFEEELYDKLYTFFHRYFTESGAITFASTPFHNDVYERIYTNENDVVLFWKTRDLYYIKTERVFKSMSFDYKDYKIFFDASNVEGKKGNEKRNVIFNLRQLEGNKIVFEPQYKEGNKETNYAEILREFKRNGISLTEEELYEVFDLYNRQADIDFFLHKRPREFLKEQFNLWLYQYLSEDHEWDLERINQFNLLRRVAFKIIDYIAEFEEELVKIWIKPRFVLNSNYVITLDKIACRKGGIEVIKKLISHSNFQKQIDEWIELNMVDARFSPEDVLKDNRLMDRYKFLPIDTKHFKDLEVEILSLFDDLDEELDGWLIKSENFQALNTILPKFRGKVQTIYIDPPYNTGSDEFIYMDKYRHSTWLTMMENRLSLARELMKEEGVIFVSIGDLNPQEGESFRLQMLMNEIFEKRFGNLIWEKRHSIGSYSEKDMTEIHEYILVFGREKARLLHNLLSSEDLEEYKQKDSLGLFKWIPLIGPSQQTKDKRPNLYYGILYCEKENKIVGIEWQDQVLKREVWADCKHDLTCIYPPKNSTWLISKDKFKEYSLNGSVMIRKGSKTYKVYLKKHLYTQDGHIRGKILKSILARNNIDVGTNMSATRDLKDMFPDGDVNSIHPKPVPLVKLLIKVSTKERDIVLDFFAGSGTTMEAVLRLNHEDSGRRKFILIETGNHFYELILPRLKKLSYSLEWKDGKPVSPIGLSVFVKYYELEQIEDIFLRINDMYSDGFCCPSSGVFETDLRLLYLCNALSKI